MDQPVRQKIQGNPRILVAPLDWGLGHTTRCIPVIRELLARGSEVFAAVNGQQHALLSGEFPNLPFLPLEGYNVRYGASSTGLYLSLLRQVPNLLRSIRREHTWLETAVKNYGFDAVISDNRFGLYHKHIPSVIITHQLNIISGLGAWTGNMLRKKNYSFINRFTKCWIPDDEINGLAGKLSHPGEMPAIPTSYLGPLSRLESRNGGPKKDHLLVILSGPEPQRSLFEKLLLPHLETYPGTVTVVRGLPGTSPSLSSSRIRVHNHLPASEMAAEMNSAEFIISRCGYSTVMDVAALGKKSILVPTPGQGEQEYLAKYLGEKRFAVTAKQKGFNLKNELNRALGFEYIFPGNKYGNSRLSDEVGNLLRLV